MLSISQSGNHFNYLNWIPTSSGPLINSVGSLSFDKPDFDSNQFYQNLFSSLIVKCNVNPPVISLSLDSSQVSFSESLLDEPDSDGSILDWVSDLNYDSEFKNRFFTYSYPVNEENRKVINIHYKKSRKDAIIEAVKNAGLDLRCLSIGIFSAEQCARFCYNADKLDSYLIWRIGGYHQNQVILVRGGKLKSLIFFKQLENSFSLQNFYGSRILTDELFSQLEQCKNHDLSNLVLPEKIFIYSATGASPDFNEINNSNTNRVCHLNPLERIKSKTDKKGTFNYKFAESGPVFRGLDV